MKLSVIIPVYNEEKTMEEVLEQVQKAPYDMDIIIVDDGSTDSTPRILKKLEDKYDNVRTFCHERNRGKGASLATGFKEVKGDIIIVQDADLEYDPADYGKLLDPITQGRADVVYGSRFLGGPHRVFMFWHYQANKTLTWLSNMFNDLNLSDMETCYKAFRKEALDGIRISERRFGVEPEITAKFARKGLRIYEVPISYHGREYREGKKIGWKDAVRALWCIIKYRFVD